MDFSLTPELQELQQRTRSFIREKIVPMESDPRQTAHGPTEAFRRELVALGREAGLLAPHASPEYGGLGLDNGVFYSSPRYGRDNDIDTNQDAWMWQTLGGSVGALVRDTVHAARSLWHGDPLEAWDKAPIPKIAGDVVKAGARMSGPRTSSSGRVTDRALTPYEAAGTALGFTPGHVADQGFYAHQQAVQKMRAQTQHTDLINGYLTAKPEDKGKAFAAAVKGGVKPADLTKAVSRVQREQKESVSGVISTKNDRARLRENARVLGLQ